MRTSGTSTADTWKRLPVLDRDRILIKLDQLYGYLAELRSILPEDLAAYRKVEKRRACEEE